MTQDSSATLLCHVCSREITLDDPAATAFARIVVADPENNTPDLRGEPAHFHLACAPDWGDPAWVSRAEGIAADLHELTTERS